MAELTDVVADSLEEAAPVIRNMDRPHPYLVVGLVAATTTMGAAIGYHVARKKLEAKYNEILEAEIQDMREHFQKRTEAIKERVHKPELGELVTDLGYSGDDNAEVIAVTEEEVVVAVEEDSSPSVETRNIFEAAPQAVPEVTDVWDYATEVKSRDPLHPYVLHIDEYKENEKDYTQSTITYYMDDDVLADEHDQVIADQDEAVGIENLDRFGHGSMDPNVLYVRNDVREIDYEILRSNGSYAEEVHGFQHSEYRSRRRAEWDG